MDAATQRLLNDKLYEKRKQGALESVFIATSLSEIADTYIIKP